MWLLQDLVEVQVRLRDLKLNLRLEVGGGPCVEFDSAAAFCVVLCLEVWRVESVEVQVSFALDRALSQLDSFRVTICDFAL